MSATTPGDADELFFDDVVAQYVREPGYVPRTWLEEQVAERLARPSCRYVLLVGEPGVGKSGVVAGLADRNPGWLRYFIRRDSTTPLSGGDAASVLLRIGHQLATRRPQLFDPARLEVVVTQRVASAGPQATVVGVRIEDLSVSPFHRTAIRVEQHVEDLAGRLVGLDVAHATVDPRLLTEDNLQYLALFDPAAVLAASQPDDQVVVLVDAVDEALRFHGGMSVLDWLERSPELPANVRVVLSSRPHPRLATLESVRAGSVELIALDTAAPAVLADTLAFAERLLSVPELAARVPGVGAAAERVARASDGNFAYLRALERGLLAAVDAGNDALLDQLLRLDVLPPGLGPLYSVLLRNARDEIARLGALEVESPRSADDEVTPAWEGAGQRMVAVLAVARAPLTLDQIIRLGSVRVWRSAADSVLQRLRPLLDDVGTAWQFFHQSVAEFLTDPGAPADVGVEPTEWHRRVVRAYRGSVEWPQVDWEAVDDYGLAHLAEHLAETGPQGGSEVIELVTAGLRTAARHRFLTDLPFSQLVATALAHVDPDGPPARVLADTLFLEVVRAHLRGTGSRVAPAVFALMARLGRVAEARARIELLPPGEHRFAATQALVAGASELEGRAGVDLLVAAAAEVPVVDASLFPGMRHREALEAAALALAPHDIDRALELATDAEPDWDPGRVADAVLLAAARVAAPGQAVDLIARMSLGRRSAAAAELAASAAPPERDTLLTLAEQHLDDAAPADRVPALALLVAAGRTEPHAARLLAAATLRTEPAADSDAEPDAFDDAVVLDAAEAVKDADPELAATLLGRLDHSTSPDSWSRIGAVRLWAALGRSERSRALAEDVLAHERDLGWYGPAGAIAELAVAVAGVDDAWAHELADEAEQLIGAAAASVADPFERSRVDGTLGRVARAFRSWAPDRALRTARLMEGGWISGSPWDSFDGRQSALACLGMDASRTDPALARALLEECAPDREPSVVLGRADPRLVRGGLFRPSEDEDPGGPATVRSANFVAYVSNCLSYWFAARERMPFTQPADVARSMQMAPGTSGSTASWASVVAAAVPEVAATDITAAIDLAGWPVDPGERLIAVAGLAAVLAARDDPLATAAMAAVGRAAVALPRYTAELDLTRIDQGPMLTYLDPSARARWEAALLLPPDEDAVAEALTTATGSWYLAATRTAHRVVGYLYGLADEEVDEQDVRGALAAVEGHPDPIQVDAARLAAVWALAPCEAADEIAESIEHPGPALMARLMTGMDVAAAMAAAPDDLPALHRITAVALTADLEVGLATLEAAEPVDPLTGTAALAMLAERAEEPARAAELVLRGLARADGIGNVHLRDDALADLLYPAALCGDVALVSTVARRLLAGDWQMLMAGLQRAVSPLLELAGTGLLDALDSAFRRAQAVLGAAADHVDGVAAPGSRQPALPLVPPAEPAPSGLGGTADRAAAGYLEQDDLPGMSLVQDSADAGPDPGDYAFAACDGLGSGLRAWMAPETGPVWRLVDIRFVFPDAARASAYHAERLLANSELNPPVPDAPPVGEECRVFGGTRPVPMAGIEMTTWFYVFRVGRVVVKLFVAQGPDSVQPLQVGHVEAIARRIVARLGEPGTEYR